MINAVVLCLTNLVSHNAQTFSTAMALSFSLISTLQVLSLCLYSDSAKPIRFPVCKATIQYLIT